MSISGFRKEVYEDYRARGRKNLPWRKTRDPYRILVSEIMLQQTQVPRVRLKYGKFITAFPTVRTLAKASLRDILRVWQGLGYNRRARYLKEAAGIIVNRYGGAVPRDEAALRALPGVGPATAAGIMAFAYDKPAVYLETNVRSAVIHYFFGNEKDIHDRDVRKWVEKTLDREHPRAWYYALLDYGAYLKKAGNPSRRSAHYAKQSAFKGSVRELRGKVLHLLTEKPRTKAELKKELKDGRLNPVLEKLEQEGLVRMERKKYAI